MLFGVEVTLKSGGTEFLAVSAPHKLQALDLAGEVFAGNVLSVEVRDLEDLVCRQYSGIAVLSTGW